MRASTIIVGALSAVSVYAKPVAQNGRWTPEWQNRNAEASGPSAPAASASVSATSSLPPLGNPSAAPNPPPNAKLVADLITAPSASDRITLLNDAKGNGTADFKFDLNPAANAATKQGDGGVVITANRKAFAALTGLDVAVAGLFYQPCGLNPPHAHRATEVLTVATEGTLLAGFVFDNVFTTEISEEFSQFQSFVFPEGSMHWQLNQECHPVTAIAAFSNEDPGAITTANRFFQNTSEDIVLAALGFPEQITPDNFDAFKDNIPAPFVKGIQQCYKKCNIPY